MITFSILYNSTLIVVLMSYLHDVISLCHKHTQRGNISAFRYICKRDIAYRGKSNSCGGALKDISLHLPLFKWS